MSIPGRKLKAKPASDTPFRRKLQAYVMAHGGVSEVARKTGINRSTMKGWLLQEKKEPSLSHLQRLVSGTKRPPTYWLDDRQKPVDIVDGDSDLNGASLAAEAHPDSTMSRKERATRARLHTLIEETCLRCIEAARNDDLTAVEKTCRSLLEALRKAQ